MLSLKRSPRMHLIVGMIASTWKCAALLLLPGIALAQSPSSDRQSPPHWVWSADGGARCRLQRDFRLEQPVQSARLRLAADFCDARVEINGSVVASVEAYAPTIDVDVTNASRRGENRIAVTAAAVGGPAAIALSLLMVDVDGKHFEVMTDHEWRVVRDGQDRGAAASLGSVEPALWGIGRRPATIDPFDNYEQWRQALGSPATDNRGAFWTAPGFEITLVRQAQPEEGSWVSMAFDPQDRLTIAREDKGLLRMTLDAARTSVEHVEPINSELQECRGLLYAHDALYASANNSKALYRLRDTDGDDQFDEVRPLREFPGNVGHGRNDLALGTDGMIYSIHGDAVDLPRDNIVDHTSPFREARRGKNSREGHLVRTDRDGKQWELVAAGLRNPFGIALNPRGDLFSYDADAEFDMGSPWYRPTRIVQLLSGGDYGWRGVTGKWPPYFPDHADNALPTLDIGKGSPTAVIFGTRTSFPPDYRRALFVLDWAYGRILAVHLAPRGAGYRAWAETFVKGRPLNVTDVTVGPDGALYFVTGGRKTQSALYRIAYGDEAAKELPPSPHAAACLKHADEARQLRLELENLHRLAGQAAVDFAWPLLNSADPTIRYAARIAVEHQPVVLWREQALKEEQPTAVLTALLALARSGEKDATPAIIDRLLRFSSADLSVGQSLALVQCYLLCLEQPTDRHWEQKSAILAQLEPLFPHPAAQSPHLSRAGSGAYLNRELARLLARLGSPSIVEKVTGTLIDSSVQEDRLQGLFLLRDVRSGWTSQTRRTYFAALKEAGSFVGGEGMPKFLAQIREQAVVTLSPQERDALADLLTAPATGENEPLPPPRPLVKHWTMDDFESALRDVTRLGDSQRGAVVFREALCIRCHRAGARGPAVGPDLTHVAGRFSVRDILESILSPSKVVAENYRNVQVSTLDGRQIIGRVASEGDFRAEKLRIAIEPLRPAAVVELSKREIDEVREAETSPMPQGLLDAFTTQEVLDLLAFLTRRPAPETERR